MSSNYLTAARLRELLHYDPATGVFTRLVRTSSNANAGDVAGTPDGDGYLQFQVDGCLYKAHRLAWLYMKGVWPSGQIDHWDTDKTNNRLTNLREATNRTNAENLRRPHKNNASGYLGVSWGARQRRWRAVIWVDGICKHLGYFDDPAIAHEAYVRAKRVLHSGCTL